MPVQVRIDKDRSLVVIELPLEEPRLSASGKTTLIATSHGLASGAAVYSSRPVMVTANAFVYLDQPGDRKERGANIESHTIPNSTLPEKESHRPKSAKAQPDDSPESTGTTGHNGRATGKRRGKAKTRIGK